VEDTNSNTSTALKAAYVPVMPTALRKWQVALGNRRAAPVAVLLADNSVGEGQGASAYANRYPKALQDSLRARFQPPGIAGAAYAYVTRSALSPVPTGVPYTESGTVTIWSQGLGGRGWHLGIGGTVTLTFTGTRAKIDYTIAGGGGVMGVQLDGGAVQLVNVNTGGAQSYGQWDSGALTAGSHTLIVTRDASSATNKDVYFDGFELFNGDEAGGIRVWDASKFGVTAQGYLSNLNDLTRATWAVAVIGFGENDTARTTTQYQADLQTIITNFRATGLASSILLIHRPCPGTYDSAAWAAFGAVKATIAAGDPDITYLDLSTSMPGYDSGGSALGFYADTKHLNDKGQSWMADLVAAELLPR
jgi:hypothetical protein